MFGGTLERLRKRLGRDVKPETVVKFPQINPFSIKFVTVVLFIL